MDAEDWASIINGCFNSPNEVDRNGEIANVVDGLFEISRALHRIADAMENGKEGE